MERGVGTGQPLVVACGALATELRAVLSQLGLAEAVDIRFLPANLHNRPDQIIPALEAVLDDAALAMTADGATRDVLIGYADCGTGGALDTWLSHRTDTHRLPGAHCYEMYAGSDVFAALHDAEPGTFYLTDFLAKHFDALVWQGLGLDRHPDLLATYFGNYTRLVFLSQSDDAAVVEMAARAAERLRLEFSHRPVGYEGLRDAVMVGIGARASR